MLIRSVQIPVKPEAGQHAELEIHAVLHACKIGHRFKQAVVLPSELWRNLRQPAIKRLEGILQHLFKIIDRCVSRIIVPQQMPQQIVQLRALIKTCKFSNILQLPLNVFFYTIIS